jgi:hypothetical protein
VAQHDVDPFHEVLPECACDLCVATRTEVFERADDATAAVLAEVDAWFSATVAEAFLPWERDTSSRELVFGCAS